MHEMCQPICSTGLPWYCSAEKHELGVLCLPLSRSPQLGAYKPGTVRPEGYPTLA
jgi:hypothetical protein